MISAETDLADESRDGRRADPGAGRKLLYLLEAGKRVVGQNGVATCSLAVSRGATCMIVA